MPNLNSTISIKDHGHDLRTARRKTEWILTGNIPKSVDDLSFVGRHGDRFTWWNITPPKTNYWHAHQILGRAYAFELLDLINNPDGNCPKHIVAHIHSSMVKWARTVEPVAAEGMQHGFFEALSEYLVTGKANR